MQPPCQPFCGGVGDLTPQVVPLIIVHELQRSTQVLQQVEHPEAAQEGRGGRLAVEEPVGVIHGLGACRHQIGWVREEPGTTGSAGSESHRNGLILLKTINL